MEEANEIQETLGRAYGMPEDIDEDDLEAGLLLLNVWTFARLNSYDEKLRVMYGHVDR